MKTAYLAACVECNERIAFAMVWSESFESFCLEILFSKKMSRELINEHTLVRGEYRLGGRPRLKRRRRLRNL